MPSKSRFGMPLKSKNPTLSRVLTLLAVLSYDSSNGLSWPGPYHLSCKHDSQCIQAGVVYLGLSFCKESSRSIFNCLM